jgi:predicted amidohydrolase YtcJ
MNSTTFEYYLVISKFEQPKHLLDDADSAIKKLGMERAQKESYLFRSLLAGNAQLAFGSDWPVSIMTHIQYFFSLHIMLNRTLIFFSP